MNATTNRTKIPNLTKLSIAQLQGLTDRLAAKRNRIAEILLRACDPDSCYYMVESKQRKNFDELFAEHLKLNDYLQFTIAPEWQRRQVIN